jgi:hypothetical protein
MGELMKAIILLLLILVVTGCTHIEYQYERCDRCREKCPNSDWLDNNWYKYALNHTPEEFNNSTMAQEFNVCYLENCQSICRGN